MNPETVNSITHVLPMISGYVYPNEQHILWSVLIVVYPYVTGLVAGAFILASMVRVFQMHSLESAYRLSLLTAFAFLLAAPLPLLLHLGHPERGIQVMITPHLSSPMAMFGFVYAWYLMAVLQLELWLDYRKDFVEWSKHVTGFRRGLYRVLTLGVFDVSKEAVLFDHRLSKIITLIGIPSAFLLHGYVGFIFGSIKANPLWANVLVPFIFILSAVVSGIALCVFLYLFLNWVRGIPWNLKCLDTMGRLLFYSLLLAFSVEAFDWVHRLYEADESVNILKELAAGKLFYTLLICQALMGSVTPLVLLGVTQLRLAEFFKNRDNSMFDRIRPKIYFISSVLVLIGVLAMRWTVVIGGQLFSTSLRGFTGYHMELLGLEGWLISVCLLILPFITLWVLIKLFLPQTPPGGTMPAPSGILTEPPTPES